MRKLRNLIGLPVIVNRQKIGRLVQAELSGDLEQLKGVWVDCGLRGTRYISSERLKLIGEMAVIADDRGKRRRCGNAFPCYRAISACGQRLGAIVGAQIDELSFMVTSLELTRGFWDDLLTGRECVTKYAMNDCLTEVIVLDAADQCEKEDES